MKKKIMIVDDEADVAFAIEFNLKKFDDELEFVKAESGEKCIELLEQNQIPDLILLDIMMPGISGWEVYKKIKENPSWKNILIVFLTARTDTTAENAGDFLGDDYVKKPYDPEELWASVKKVLCKN